MCGESDVYIILLVYAVSSTSLWLELCGYLKVSCRAEPSDLPPSSLVFPSSPGGTSTQIKLLLKNMFRNFFSSNSSSNCHKNSNCDECVGTLSDSSSSCVWCSSSSTCLSEDENDDDLLSSSSNCNESNLHHTCNSTYYITIFIIITASLIFLCCVACLLRKMNHNSNNYSSLYSPLLGIQRSNSINSQDQEWMCTICGFDNISRSKFCHLCGTSHEFTTDYSNEKQKQKSFRKKKRKKEILIPKDAQIDSSPGTAARGLSFSSVPGGLRASGQSYGVTEDERREALNYRRLNQLTLRQKGARRRRMWQRALDEETGELVWVRVNFKEAMKAAKHSRGSHEISSPFPPSSPHDAAARDNPSIFNMLQSLRDNPRTFSVQSASTAGRLDSFDAVLNSHSPGYTSYLDPSGQIQWEKLESGSMNVNPSASYNLSSGRAERGGYRTHSNTFHPSYQDIILDLLPHDVQTIIALPFQEKISWFYDTISHLQRPWGDGLIRLDIHRENLFEDSFTQLMSISLTDGAIYRWMRVQFLGESGIDAGGIEREWFLLITQQLFDYQTGLFCQSGGVTGSSNYHINPLAHLIYPQTYLQYYHFAGRLLAKAIMEQQQIAALLSIPLRKHLLGIPITFSDLEFVDLELYRNLCWLRDYDEDEEDEEESEGGGARRRDGSSLGGIEALGLVFSVDYSFGGKVEEEGQEESKERKENDVPRQPTMGIESGRIYQESYELIPNGSEILVTSETKNEYLELRLRHRMLDSMKQPLESFLKGFYEVIPMELITVFDYQELELLMCGLPTIDFEDWKRNTEYLGEYYRLGPKHKIIRWFWEVVKSYSDEERIRLLQFTTGCSRLPAKGFKALQSNDGNIRRFNIQSIRKTVSANRLPPPYSLSFCRTPSTLVPILVSTSLTSRCTPPRESWRPI